MNRSHLIRRRSPRVETVRRRSILLGAVLTFLVSCGDGGAGPGDSPVYTVVAGACGRVVFVERIGVDLESALAVIEARNEEQFGAANVKLELNRLEVVDDRGVPPAADFFYVVVLDAHTEELLPSSSHVITTEGGLFRLEWCPD